MTFSQIRVGLQIFYRNLIVYTSILVAVGDSKSILGAVCVIMDLNILWKFQGYSPRVSYLSKVDLCQYVGCRFQNARFINLSEQEVHAQKSCTQFSIISKCVLSSLVFSILICSVYPEARWQLNGFSAMWTRVPLSSVYSSVARKNKWPTGTLCQVGPETLMSISHYESTSKTLKVYVTVSASRWIRVKLRKNR